MYKISGHPGILTPKIVGGLNLGIRRIAMFYTVCLSTSIYGTDAHRFWRTTGFNDMVIRRIPTFSPLICTLAGRQTRQQGLMQLRQEYRPGSAVSDLHNMIFIVHTWQWHKEFGNCLAFYNLAPQNFEITLVEIFYRASNICYHGRCRQQMFKTIKRIICFALRPKSRQFGNVIIHHSLG